MSVYDTYHGHLRPQVWYNASNGPTYFLEIFLVNGFHVDTQHVQMFLRHFMCYSCHSLWSSLQQLITHINSNQIIVISGETGCGKTTQVSVTVLPVYGVTLHGWVSQCHLTQMGVTVSPDTGEFHSVTWQKWMLSDTGECHSVTWHRWMPPNTGECQSVIWHMSVTVVILASLRPGTLHYIIYQYTVLMYLSWSVWFRNSNITNVIIMCQ